MRNVLLPLPTPMLQATRLGGSLLGTVAWKTHRAFSLPTLLALSLPPLLEFLLYPLECTSGYLLPPNNDLFLFLPPFRNCFLITLFTTVFQNLSPRESSKEVKIYLIYSFCPLPASPAEEYFKCLNIPPHQHHQKCPWLALQL